MRFFFQHAQPCPPLGMRGNCQRSGLLRLAARCCAGSKVSSSPNITKTREILREGYKTPFTKYHTIIFPVIGQWRQRGSARCPFVFFLSRCPASAARGGRFAGSHPKKHPTAEI